MDILNKVCTQCGYEKPIDDFYPRYRAKGDYDSKCKVCKNINIKERRIKNKPLVVVPKTRIVERPSGSVKVCTGCKQEKPLNQYYTQKTARDGLSTRCRICFKLHYRASSEEQNRKALERYYERMGKPMPEFTKQYNTKVIPYDGSIPVIPTFNLEKWQAAREQWRAVFNERYDDIMKMLKDYDDDKSESVHIVLEFHSSVRPTWKLKHKSTDKYEEHFRKYGSSGW